MPSALRSAVVFAFVSAIAALTVPGCSQQGEGERCDSAKNGDQDCDSGLTCVRKGELLEGITDRCCPAEGSESDKRCTRGVATSTGSAGTSSSTAGSSTAGSSAEPSAGASGSPATDAGGQGGQGGQGGAG